MKTRKYTSTQLTIYNENNKRIDKKIPFRTYYLSDLELLYIKTSLYTHRCPTPTKDKVYLENSQIQCDFVFGYVSKDLFVVIEQIKSVVYIYHTPKINIPASFFPSENIIEKSISKTHYIIGEFMHTDINKTSEKVVEIIEVPNYLTLGDFDKYPNLETLLEKSSLYISLPKSKKTKVLSNKKELLLEHLILSIKGKNISPSAIQHTLVGNVIERKVKGIHHIFAIIANFVEIEEITKYPDKFGVWEAKVIFLDKRPIRGNNVITPKKNKYKPSTFFPNHWHLIRLNDECFYAMEHKTNPIEDNNGSQIKWSSTTKSGVKVEIWTDKNKNLNSIYPIYSDDSM